MSYQKVCPRDLFNESALLKCVGKLIVLLDDTDDFSYLHYGDKTKFEIVQNPSSGAIYIQNLALYVGGKSVEYERLLNSRDSWCLYVNYEGDDEVIDVFDEDGNLTDEAKSFFGYQAK